MRKKAINKDAELVTRCVARRGRLMTYVGPRPKVIGQRKFGLESVLVLILFLQTSILPKVAQLLSVLTTIEILYKNQ